MLTPEQLQGILKDLEADQIERTISTRDTDKFAKAICAFANDLPNHKSPGFLILGVNDDGTPSGLTVTDQLLQNLAALRSDGNIQPLPAITVTKYGLEGGEVAVVAIEPSDLPPVRYKGQVWIRVGPRRGIASEQEERILSERRLALARSFDARPCAEAKIDDLALGLFEAYRREAIASDVIAANQRIMEEQLSSLRFYDLHRHCPTNAGLLLFGKNPRFYLPGAYIQYLRFPGNKLNQIPEDQAEISGDLLSVLRELDSRLRLQAQSMHPVSAMREKVLTNYPETALRELLANAVMHRSYESNTPIRFYWFADRIEIQSPGGLYGEVTPQNYLTHNSYRNPVIAEAMKALGYVNRFGYGISRAQQFLADNGNPPAEFIFDTNAVGVIVRRRNY